MSLLHLASKPQVCLLARQTSEGAGRAPNSWLDVRLFCSGSNPELAEDHQQNGHTKDAVLRLDDAAMDEDSKQPQHLDAAMLGQRHYSLASPFFLKPR